MLDDKLEAARAESSRKREQFILGAVGLIVLVAVLWFCFLGVKQFLENREKERFTAGQEKASETIPSSPVQLSEETVPSNSDIDDEDTIDSEELRTQFKELLKSFESEVESKLPPGNGWKNEELFEIVNLKREALSSFGRGDYSEALERLESAKFLASSVIEETDKSFDEQFDKAETYYRDDLYEEARLHIEKALFIKPQQQKGLELQREIETLRQLLPILAAVEVAKTENDLQKEYGLLAQVEQLSPDRAGVKERIAELELLIKEQAFATHIDAAFSFVERGRAGEARASYEKARKIDPTRTELKVLSGQLAALEKRLRVKSALNQAEQAIRRDDWQTAYNYFNRAAKDVPQDSRVQEGLTRSKAIMGLKKEIQSYLADPYKLSDSAVAIRAEQLLKRVESFSQSSFSLQLQSRELSAKMTKMQQQIAVTVLSDNKTFVQVRGVGRVGKVSEKVIRLKPGRYTFEGQRDGYTTKLVKVLIPYDQSTFQIQVICDQPI